MLVMQHHTRYRMMSALIHLLVIIGLGAASAAYSDAFLDKINHITPEPNWPGEGGNDDAPTTPNIDDDATSSAPLSQEDSFQLSKNIATQFLLGKMLRALGPKFEDRLPSPTNATLTPLNSTLRVETGQCPDYYRRCSSQTFYPSCEIPRNTDEQMWNQRFTFFFNISEEISSIHRDDILNATLRLYKNLSLPLTNPRTLIVKLHAFTRSLKRNRERSVAVASTRVDSDYVGWVFMDVAKLIRRLKGRSNYGVKISVQNENNVPWNIPDLFIKMDCQASNESLIPLPFEVQLDVNTQRYPALNIRSGTEEVFTDNDEYLNMFNNQVERQNENFDGGNDYNRLSNQRRNRPYNPHRRSKITDPVFRNSFRPSNGHINQLNSNQQRFHSHQPDLDQLINPHLYNDAGSQSDSNVINPDTDPHFNLYGDDIEDDIDESDLGLPGADSPNMWNSGHTFNDQSLHQPLASRYHQPRFKKQSPALIPSEDFVNENTSRANASETEDSVSLYSQENHSTNRNGYLPRKNPHTNQLNLHSQEAPANSYDASDYVSHNGNTDVDYYADYPIRPLNRPVFASTGSLRNREDHRSRSNRHHTHRHQGRQHGSRQRSGSRRHRQHRHYPPTEAPLYYDDIEEQRMSPSLVSEESPQALSTPEQTTT